MTARHRNVKGTRDLLWPETHLWSRVEATARQVFHAYGYGEIRTPMLEETDLFIRAVGQETDIVGKEMYSFEDRKGRSLTLRPESTAGVGRAFVQHGMEGLGLPVKLFYIGPHFRYERPQRGRYREFHQIGAELIGDPGPTSDAELILMLVRFLEALGFLDLTVLVNSVGDGSSRAAYREALRSFLEPHRTGLGEDSRRRLETNPLRILDTKDPAERDLLANAPRLDEFLSAESRAHFGDFRTALGACGVTHRLEPRLVRGLDYYALTVFEISAAGLGAQDALVGGGRYDGLLAELGGPDLPAIGFAIGEDRLLEAMTPPPNWPVPRPPEVHVIGIGVPGVESLRLAEELRNADRAPGTGGPAVTSELSERSLKATLRWAASQGRRWAVLVGEAELAAGTVTVKDLRTGEQRSVPRGEASRSLVRKESDS